MQGAGDLALGNPSSEVLAGGSSDLHRTFGFSPLSQYHRRCGRSSRVEWLSN